MEDIPDETRADELKTKRRELMAPIRKLRNRKRHKEVRLKLKLIEFFFLKTKIYFIKMQRINFNTYFEF